MLQVSGSGECGCEWEELDRGNLGYKTSTSIQDTAHSAQRNRLQAISTTGALPELVIMHELSRDIGSEENARSTRVRADAVLWPRV